MSRALAVLTAAVLCLAAPASAAPWVPFTWSGSVPAHPWLVSPIGDQSLVTPLGSYGVALTATPTSPGPNGSSELTSVYLGSAYADAYAGDEAWYHLQLKLPSASYQPTTGQWNWLAEWHTDGRTCAVNCNSIALGVYTDYPVLQGAVGQNPTLVLRLAGGQAALPIYQPVSAGPLLFDHWYDLAFHFVWSPDASVGRVDWFIDGREVVSEPFATLFTDPDGSVAYNTFGIYNYRLAAPWTSTVDFRNVLVYGAER